MGRLSELFLGKNRSDTLVVAIEGIKGSGKSSVTNALSVEMSRLGIRSIAERVTGFRSDNKSRRLYSKMVYDEELIKKYGDLKAIERRKKDIFCRVLAQHHTFQLLKKIDKKKPQVAVIDRTPFLSWISCALIDNHNPYLLEMFDEAVQLSNRLNIRTIYNLEIAPELALSRIIARNVNDRNNLPEEIRNILDMTPLNENEKRTIGHLTNQLILHSGELIQPKKFRRFDLMGLEKKKEEQQLCQIILNTLHTELGVRIVTVNANQPADNIVNYIKNDLFKNDKI